MIFVCGVNSNLSLFLGSVTHSKYGKRLICLE